MIFLFDRSINIDLSLYSKIYRFYWVSWIPSNLSLNMCFLYSLTILSLFTMNYQFILNEYNIMIIYINKTTF